VNPAWLTPPRRRAEHISVSNEYENTYKSDDNQRWPESGTDSVKTPKISPELQQIIAAWPELPDHIKAAIKTLIQTHICTV
jgi:hypothetical protein